MSDTTPNKFNPNIPPALDYSFCQVNQEDAYNRALNSPRPLVQVDDNIEMMNLCNERAIHDLQVAKGAEQ